MKTGLVLEGGAMRGIYTAGVLDVFLEHGIHFDGVIGVSAGALHGCSFVSEQKGRSLRYIKKYRNVKITKLLSYHFSCVQKAPPAHKVFVIPVFFDITKTSSFLFGYK